MALEDNIGKMVKDKGIAVTVMSRQTGIPYMSLYDSLFNENSKRKLRGQELIDVCAFLGVNPMDFADKSGGSVK